MAKLFTFEREGFGMCGVTDYERAAKVERHIAEAHSDLVGKPARRHPREARARAEGE